MHSWSISIRVSSVAACAQSGDWFSRIASTRRCFCKLQTRQAWVCCQQNGSLWPSYPCHILWLAKWFEASNQSGIVGNKFFHPPLQWTLRSHWLVEVLQMDSASPFPFHQLGWAASPFAPSRGRGAGDITLDINYRITLATYQLPPRGYDGITCPD